MKFTIVEKSLDDIKADYEIIFVVNKDLNHKFIKDGNEFDFFKFKGENVLNLTSLRRIYVGIKDLEPNSVRLGVANAYNALKDLNLKTIKMASYVGCCFKMSFQAISEGFLLGSYKFDKYKTEKKESSISEIYISTDEFSGKQIALFEANLGLQHAQIIAESTNYAKDIVNEIPDIYTPQKMAEDAKKLSLSYPSIECKIHDENYIKSQNMHAFLAVNRASAHPPRLIHLKYTPKDNSLKKIVFVGKGLTYDSGGLSLKPSD
ncbi:aminopeptidase A, partial [Campylobacter fetus subsp. testudinum]